MSEQRLPDEKWRSLFDRAGIEFGYRPLAAKAGIEYTRARRVLIGLGTTDAAVSAVASAFGVTPDAVRKVRGESRSVVPFTLPDDAGRLNDKERDVIRAMVRALLDAKDSRHAEQPATDTADPTAAARAQGTENQKTDGGELRVAFTASGRVTTYTDDTGPEDDGMTAVQISLAVGSDVGGFQYFDSPEAAAAYYSLDAQAAGEFDSWAIQGTPYPDFGGYAISPEELLDHLARTVWGDIDIDQAARRELASAATERQTEYLAEVAAQHPVKPTDLSERRSRREAGSRAPSNLTTDDVREESPEDAIAARTRDPRFAPDDPAGYYGTNDIGEENQDPGE
ncbi:hypothetical protein [Gordonia malaquae]|uniref:hypothetical protein n=1 Tax=Gordonia malaquae TaxID=410332 RepID=UPI0030194C85